MDSLHFYLFHCYDVGIRIKTADEQNEEEEEKINDNQYFDAAFSRVDAMISERAYITKHFDRFSRKKNTKFSIKTEAEEEQIENGNTYLDAIYGHLQCQKFNKTYIKQLNQFIQDEEYDTDTIEYDVGLI
eukprot:517227_1